MKAKKEQKAQRKQRVKQHEESQQHQQKVLDDALEGSFPASDPVQLTEPGTKHDPAILPRPLPAEPPRPSAS